MNSLVNFRGSLAFGQKPLHSLPGKIGTQDVQDVQVQFFFRFLLVFCQFDYTTFSRRNVLVDSL